MPEALGNRYNPAQPNFEVKRRDEREAAVQVSKKLSEAKLADSNSQRTAQNAQHREEIRVAAAEEKKALLKADTVRQGEETIDKRRAQDKANPDSGNIINVVA